MLAAGEGSGPGRMPEPEILFAHVGRVLDGRSGVLRGKHVLITAGPTREAIDPVRFISNHSSALDAVIMLQALPSRLRYRAFVVAAADSIFKHKWEASLTELLINTFPIPRAGGARPALDRLKEHLSHGWSVVIFPEGTLSRTGNIGTFKKGAAILAIDAGVPIVPAYVEGLYEVFPRFRRIPRHHASSIKFGDPLRP